MLFRVRLGETVVTILLLPFIAPFLSSLLKYNFFLLLLLLSSSSHELEMVMMQGNGMHITVYLIYKKCF